MGKNVDISSPEFRDRFARFRDRLNLTPAELASRAGVSERTVKNIENAVRDYAQEKTLRMLASALGVTYGELVHGESPPPEPPPPTPAPAPATPVSAGRRMPAAAVVAIVVVLMAVAGFAVNEWMAGPQVIDDAISVSVTCFDNHVDPDDPGRLGMILRELIVNELSESRYVRVVSRPELDHGSGSDHRAQELKTASRAGVRWVLFGSILRTEPGLVLTARLEDASDGTVMGTQQVTAAAGETEFDVAARLAAQVKRDLILPRGESTEKGLPIARVTTRSVRAYRHYVEGVDNLHRLYRGEARAELRKAVQDDSTFAMAMIMLCHPEIAGPRAERDSLLAMARRHDGDLTARELHYMDIFEAWSDNRLREAISASEALVADYPNEAEAYRLMSRFYNNRRENAKAVAALETAVRVDPFDGMSLNRLAYQYAADGDFDRAIKCIDEYVRLAPSEANPYDSRGDLLAWSNRPQEAIASYKMALTRNPTFFPAMQNLGCQLTLAGQYEDAERYFRMMLGSEDPGARSRGRWFLGMMEIYRGHLDEAEVALRQAMAADELEHSHSSAYVHKLAAIARIQYAQGRRQEAIATQARARDPEAGPGDQVSTEWIVGYIAMLSSEDVAAARDTLASWWEEVRAAGVKQHYALDAAEGWIRLNSGDADGACDVFERAAARYNRFLFRYPLAVAYLEAGRTDDAIRTLEHSLHRYSSDRLLNAIWGVKLYYQLGRAYEQAGRIEEATTMYSRFVSIWKDGDLTCEEIGDAQGRIAVLDQTP